MRNSSLSYPRSAGLERLALRTWLRTVPALLRQEQVLVFVLMLVGLVAQGFNMFHYPAFTAVGDEGIYAEQAWAVLALHRLSYYTYFYDHAPVGWIQTAIFMGLTGGIHTFGTAIMSGRVFMLILHVAMVPLLYRLSRKLGANAPAATVGVLLFSLSPLAIYYQRLLMLDNIMMFWILLSLDLLLDGWGRLSRVVLSGFCYGIAMLSKETAVFLLPAMLYIVIQQRWRHQANFGISGWLLPMGIVVSWYPLYAMLKGELLPAGEALRFLLFNINSGNHVSLISSLEWQATRTGGGMFDLNNQFWQTLRGDWAQKDPALIITGVVAMAVNLVRGIKDKDRRSLAAGLLLVFGMYYLARGGLVLGLYVILVIPFLCLNIAVVMTPLLKRLPAVVAGALALLTVGAFVGGYLHAGTLQPLFTDHPDQAGLDVIAWVKKHVPPQSKIILDDSLWTDLHVPGEGGPGFPYVESHWKVAGDPAIKNGIFHDNWRNVDYLITFPTMVNQLFPSTNDTVAMDAMKHAHLVKRFTADDYTEIDIYKVDKPGQTEANNMASSAAYMQGHFEQAGAYVDSTGVVTSEAESYALLRDVWSNNPNDFAQTWSWSRSHLLNADGLLSWEWRKGAVASANNASDADTDAALALLMAGKRWSNAAYITAGTQIAQAIWRHDVVDVNGTPYLSAGNWASTNPSVVALNPSYFSPAAYHIFQVVDPSHNWNAVVDSSYTVLFNASKQKLGGTQTDGLPPDWVGLQRSNGALVPLAIPKQDPTGYGYDAARTFWRVALDWNWDHDGRAKAFLDQAGFLNSEVQRKGYVSAVYSHSGGIVTAAPSTVGDAGALAALLTLNPATGNELYDGQLVGGAESEPQGIAWGDPSSLYSQEWGWFATAMYANALPNLWLHP